jgi:putative ABC transport system ATP-binding protein
VIELRGISRLYEVGGRPVHALKDIDLTIPAGDYDAVMGPSGSGKSTLLNVLGTLDRPTSGSYRLDGEEVTELDERAISKIRRHRIGFVFQAFHLIPRLTAAANIELPMVFAGIERAERAQRVERAINEMGLEERASHRPDELSAGQRQRVAIGRSIVMGPSILLADEPTGNLDTATGEEVITLLEKMNAGGLTLIVVTHDPGIGDRAARKILLRDGSIVEDSKKVRA